MNPLIQPPFKIRHNPCPRFVYVTNFVSDPGRCFVLTVVSINCHLFRTIIGHQSVNNKMVRVCDVKWCENSNERGYHLMTMSNWGEPGYNVYKWSTLIFPIQWHHLSYSRKDWFCIKKPYVALGHRFDPIKRSKLFQGLISRLTTS